MKSYVLSVISASFICGIIELLLKKDSAIGKISRLLGRLLIVISLIAPLTTITFHDLYEYIDSVHINAEAYAEEGKNIARNQATEIIMPKLEAYILDKAAQLQCDLSVNILLSDDTIPVPIAIELSGNVSPYAKGVLCSYIEETLGIARENQRWN